MTSPRALRSLAALFTLIATSIAILPGDPGAFERALTLH
jgi:hypothetical protein